MKQPSWDWTSSAQSTTAGRSSRLPSKSRSFRLHFSGPQLKAIGPWNACPFHTLESYATDFSKYMHGGALFPREGEEETERSLFQIPAILSAHIVDEDSHGGLGASVWSNDPLVSSERYLTFGEEKAATLTEPVVRMVRGRTMKGRSITVAIYEWLVIDSATGKPVKMTITFDAEELKKAGAPASPAEASRK